MRALAAAVLAIGMGAPACAPPLRIIDYARIPDREVPIVLTGTDGLAYDALLTLPHADPIALAVLFGGGSVTDMHWTVPATIEVEGETIPLTTGGDTRDADAIARALLGRSIAVFQYSSIHTADPHYPDSPGMAMGVPYPQARAIARLALTEALARSETANLPVICIGHSLGAARALQVACDEPRIAGFIVLSGAYLSDPIESPSRIGQPVVDAMRAAGADLDAGATARQWRAALTAAPPPLREISFAEINLDRDGIVQRWEVISAWHCAMLDAGDRSFAHQRDVLMDEPMPAAIAIDMRVPTVAIYGGLDPMAYHGRMVTRAAADAGEASWLTVEYHRGLGHNLGSEAPRVGGHADVAGPMLVGPIDGRICDRIAAFAEEIALR